MSSLRVALLLALAATALGGPTARASTEPPALDAALERLVADGVPGAMALARRGGKTSYATAGVANLATREPIRTHHRYRVGSETKSFMATVVLQLEAEGRLRLDDPVERWLPGLVPNGAAITLRMLLNHTSGLSDYADGAFYRQIVTFPFRDYAPRELIGLATAKPPVCAPGACWSYSNAGYFLLGLVVDAVERVPPSAERYGPVAEVYARLVAPLRLWHTSFPVTDPYIRGPHTHGYAIGLPREWGLPEVLDTTYTNPSWAWSAGAMISTLDDIARFYRALFAGRLLPPAQMREMLTTVPVFEDLEYGLGVFRLKTPCGDALGHDGGVPAGLSTVLVSPDGARQAVVMVNRDLNTFTDAMWDDWDAATIAAFCGEAAPRGAAERLAPTPARLSGQARRR